MRANNAHQYVRAGAGFHGELRAGAEVFVRDAGRDNGVECGTIVPELEPDRCYRSGTGCQEWPRVNRLCECAGAMSF